MVTLNSTMADTLFGNSTSIGSGSFLSASNFGDLAMMRSGVYGKLMKSYVSQITEDADISETSEGKKTNADAFKNSVSEKMQQLRSPKTAAAESESNKALSDIKSASKNLETAANDLMEIDFETSTRDEVYDAVKKFVSSYNSVVQSAAKTDNVSVTKSVQWMTDDMKAHEKMLAKVGISVGKDGTLSLDEEKFKAANQSDIEFELGKNSSIVSKSAYRATGLYNLAANQISFGSGNSFYSSSGVLK